LLASKYVPQVLSYLEETNDLVVIDTPPVGVVTDALGLAASAGATILVIKAGTSARQAQKTIDALRRVGANVVGIVLNRARLDKAAGYYYYEGYGGADDSDKSGGIPAATSDEAIEEWSPVAPELPALPPAPVGPPPAPHAIEVESRER
jgi:Mrp family chromosome partitioning ATPase